MRADASCDGARSWAFVAAIHFVVAVQHGLRVHAWFPVHTSVPRCAFTQAAGWGGDVCARGLDASEYRVAREVGQHAKARFKGSISHLEKPKVRILNYPTMGESDGRLLAMDGDA